MGISRFAIDNPVKITVGVILLVLFGLLSLLSVRVQLTPDVDRPVITVKTRWTGASPQEIESEIVDRQEEKLKNVSGLAKMTSTSRENQGEILLNEISLYENLPNFPPYISFIPHEDAFDPLLTVQENIDYASALRAPHFASSERKRRGA